MFMRKGELKMDSPLYSGWYAASCASRKQNVILANFSALEIPGIIVDYINLKYTDGEVYSNDHPQKGEPMEKWVVSNYLFVKVENVDLLAWEKRERFLFRFLRKISKVRLYKPFACISEEEIRIFRDSIKEFTKKAMLQTREFEAHDFVVITGGLFQGHMGTVVGVKRDILKIVMTSNLWKAPLFIHKSKVRRVE